MGSQRNQDLSRLFEASSLRQIAGGIPTQLLIDVARDLGVNRGARRLHEVLDLAHQSLARGRRTEYFYKNQLINKIVFGVHSPRTTSVFSEFRVADSRADLIFVNKRATVYEIKTDFDDLSKAKKQSLDYFRCFTDVTFVLAPGHVCQAQKELPAEVGLTVINDRGGIQVVRSPERTTSLLDKEAIFNCLVKDEYQKMLTDLGAKSDIGYEDAIALLESVDVLDMQGYLVRCLRSRGGRKMQSIGWSTFPSTLIAAAYSYKLSPAQWRSVLAVLDTPIDDIL